MKTFCINCGKQKKICENGLCKKCATYLFLGENDDFIGFCPDWWNIMEKVKKYKELDQRF